MADDETSDAFEPQFDVPLLTLAEVLELEGRLSRNPSAQRILAQLMARPDMRRFDPATLRLRLLDEMDAFGGL